MRAKARNKSPGLSLRDAWDRQWEQHWSKVGQPGYELPVGGPGGDEREFLATARTPQKERARLKRITGEFGRAFKTFADIGPAVTVFGSARFKETHPYYKLARQVGSELARAGFATLTGGGPGIMEAANRGAFDVGAESIGFNIALPHPQFPNPYITPELCFRFHYFALRKLHFLLRAKALVAFPGGYGTLDEVFEALALVQTRKIRPLPIVLVGERFWRRAFDVDFLVEEGVIEPEDRELFWFAETAPDIRDGIRHWHTLTAEAPEPATYRP